VEVVVARVLIVDDDQRLSQSLQKLLAREGFFATHAADGPTGVRRATSEPFDLMILDVMLPGYDGFEVLRKVREHSQMPVLMLSAKGGENDRVIGLDLGADDYLTKPFSPRELISRIRAVLRRTETRSGPPIANEMLKASDIEMDVPRRTVLVAGQEIALTTTEFDLLRCFLRHPGQVLSRDVLMDMLRGVGYAAYDRSIDVHVKNLRSKIEPDTRNPKYIKTVWGTGYLLAAELAAPMT
jgi:DNA-binding response OmpR family regulator